jgi:hypothetical protein
LVCIFVAAEYTRLSYNKNFEPRKQNKRAREDEEFERRLHIEITSLRMGGVIDDDNSKDYIPSSFADFVDAVTSLWESDKMRDELIDVESLEAAREWRGCYSRGQE